MKHVSIRPPLVVLAVVAAFALVAAFTASDAASPMDVELIGASPGDVAPRALLPNIPSSTYPYYTTLKNYTFDNNGAPDAQGWTTHDLTVQDGVFWKVENFAGLPAPYAPISGTKSMWCGLRAGAVVDPAYASLPGYGNRWTQILESQAYAVAPYSTIRLDYRINFDLRAPDRVDVEYKSAAGVWILLASHTGYDFSNSYQSWTVSGANVGETIQFRFVMSSSYSNSDEDSDTDGAVILDDIFVWNLSAGTSLSLEFFDGYPVGSTSTTYWTGVVPAGFGNYAGLVSGASVVQTGTPNVSNMWSFFNGSPENYGCGGYPAQVSTPKTANPGSTRLTDYLANEIRSPYIDLSVDQNFQPVDPSFGAVNLEFDVYRDLPLSDLVVYAVRARFLVGGAPTPWQGTGFVYYSDTPEWYRFVRGAFAIPTGATHVQVGLVALDFAYNSGTVTPCHTHAPLFDNVTVYRMYKPYLVINTNDSGSGSLRQAITSSNTSSDLNPILFDIPGTGPHTITLASPLPAITRPVWIDGFSQAGSAANYYAFLQSTATMKVALNGAGAGAGANGLNFAPGSYGVVRGLVIGGFSGAGIRSESTSLIVTGCYIGTDIWGTTALPNGIGIDEVAFQTDIGGPLNEERMVIAGNTGDGIRAQMGSGPIFNCYVGADAAGGSMGNGGHGIHVTGGSICQIGQPPYDPCVTTYTDRMLIAHNTGDGIRVEPAASGVLAYQARIFGNGGMGIDLGGDGPTANDALDSDTGANSLTNYPVLSSADGVSVYGSIDAKPNASYRIEFFRNATCDGEGETFIGSTDVLTDGTGHADITLTCAPIPPASIVTTTATDIAGNSVSEFSPCITSMNSPPGAPVVDLYDMNGILRASVDFFDGTAGGNTYLSPTTPPVPVPSGWDVGGSPAYWDIVSDAVYPTSGLRVYLHYDENNIPGPEAALRLLHFNEVVWEDITDQLDTVGNKVGGITETLSPFVIAISDGATGVRDRAVPAEFALHANIPNPFNPVTTITYDVPAGGADVSLSIYDVSGRRVRTLVDEHRGAGQWSAMWNGEDDRGVRAASGVYFYQLKAGSFAETKKMVLLK